MREGFRSFGLTSSQRSTSGILLTPSRPTCRKLRGVELDTADHNIERARYLRRYLNKEDGTSPPSKN